VPAAFAARFGCSLTILRKVARVVRGAPAAMAVLAALPAGFRGTFAIIGEIAGAMLSTNMTRA